MAGLISDLLETAKLARSFYSVWFIILPVAYGISRSWRSNQNVRPVTSTLLLMVGVVAAAGAVQVMILHNNAPQNVFLETGMSLQASGDLVMKLLRGRGTFTGTSTQAELLQERLQSIQGRKLYALYGPAIANCSWCDIRDTHTLLLYNLVDILIAYLVNGLAFLFATSPGPNYRQWRFTAVTATIALFVYDIYSIMTYPLHTLDKARTPLQTDWAFWRLRNQRAGLLILSDALIAVMLVLSNTGRMFDVGDYTPNQLVKLAADSLKQSETKLHAANLIHDATLMDESLSSKSQQFYREARHNRHEFLEGDDELLSNAREEALLSFDGPTVAHAAGELVEAQLTGQLVDSQENN